MHRETTYFYKPASVTRVLAPFGTHVVFSIHVNLRQKFLALLFFFFTMALRIMAKSASELHLFRSLFHNVPTARTRTHTPVIKIMERRCMPRGRRSSRIDETSHKGVWRGRRLLRLGRDSRREWPAILVFLGRTKAVHIRHPSVDR